jgi:bifunctional NMN adenylyltransferase/nudix hydrolase
MAKTKVGVIIGRFQVPKLTDAHRKMIEAVAADGNDVLAFLVGVSPTDGRSAENPLSFAQRQPLFGAAMVFPLADEPTDEGWSKSVDALLDSTFPADRNVVTLYGGRKSFEASYTGHYPCQHVDVGSDISGTATREAVKASASPEFLAGQIYALTTQYPRCYPTVDTIVWRSYADHPMEREVLMIRRADHGQWGFIGGFVDPSDESYEYAAKREVHEEVGLFAESALRYVASLPINDWRYQGTRDRIMTTLFLMQYSFGAVRPNPTEVQDYQWVKLDDVEALVAPVHRAIWTTAEPILRHEVI